MKTERDISTLFFPVSLEDIYIKNTDESVLSLIRDDYTVVKNFKAVVAYREPHNRAIFSVVTDKYDLVTNENLYNKVINTLTAYLGINKTDLEPHYVELSTRGSQCSFAIKHKAALINLGAMELYTPYFAIRNSYNKSIAVEVSLGFIRNHCDNGIIWEARLTEIKVVHTKGNLLDTKLDTAFRNKFDSEVLEFKAFINWCKATPFPLGLLTNLCAKVFLPKKVNTIEYESGQPSKDFQKVVIAAATQYQTLGHNLHMVMNVLTELAKGEHERIEGLPLHLTATHEKRRIVGAWLRKIFDRYRIENVRIDWVDLLSERMPVG